MNAMAVVIGPRMVGVATLVGGEMDYGSGDGWAMADRVYVQAPAMERVYIGRMPGANGRGEWDDWLVDLERTLNTLGHVDVVRIEQVPPDSWQGQPDFGLLPEERVASQLMAMEHAARQT